MIALAPAATAVSRVVVIDDEPEIGELVSAAAESLGMNSTSITSVLELDGALTQDVTAIFIDLMMPGVDGIELIRQLAQHGCGASIVLMSGHDKSVLRSAEDMARALGLRTAGFLSKPFRISEVEDRLDHLGRWPRQPVSSAGRGEPLTEQELIDAVRNESVVIHYQPQISLASRRIVGVEALARIQHPDRGIVYPDLFIARAEELGQIDALTDVVLRRAVMEFASLDCLAGATLSVNVSARSLVDLSLPERLIESAQRHGMALSRLIVEITESGLIQELGKALDILARLRLRGAGVSIDDFGTGYASMALLRRIPCTELKIDRMFVNDMLTDDAALTLVQETIELAHRLKLHVVAEGIETEAHASALTDAGCEIAQGYFYSRPVALADLHRWITLRESM